MGGVNGGTVLVTGAAAVWGLAVGALLPRPAYRLAVDPDDDWHDHCPHGGPLPPGGRGWLGPARCADGWFGPRTPLVMAVTAALCALLAGATGARPELAVWLLAAPVGVLLALVDLSVRRLPDVLTLPLAAGAVLLLGAAALLPGHGGHWLGAVLGAVAVGAGFLVLFLVNPDGLGFGDVKLAPALGAVLGWYGWGAVFVGTFAGFLFATLYGVVLVVLGRATRRTPVPFGPFLLAGALVGVLLGGYAG
ncbi:prepilin peptidase [Streptomyces sp. SID4919]|nr:prepilin peptidase [Streptomyces sp. SID4919]SCK57023.1 leader peptidase (prepilin peptidase) / N-methyltransferase [Streptomyces sp. AmelKG-E11A]